LRVLLGTEESTFEKDLQLAEFLVGMNFSPRTAPLQNSSQVNPTSLLFSVPLSLSKYNIFEEMNNLPPTAPQQNSSEVKQRCGITREIKVPHKG